MAVDAAAEHSGAVHEAGALVRRTGEVQELLPRVQVQGSSATGELPWCCGLVQEASDPSAAVQPRRWVPRVQRVQVPKQGRSEGWDPTPAGG